MKRAMRAATQLTSTGLGGVTLSCGGVDPDAIMAVMSDRTVGESLRGGRVEAPVKLLVLTDIGGDPDDQQSMVRLMAHSNEFEIVGLIATSRMGHGEDTRPELIEEIVRAYGEVRLDLSKHASGYRLASDLLPLVKSGTPAFDKDDVSKVIGPGMHTGGSGHIIRTVDAATDGRLVHICIWGGAADLAQALHDVRRTRSPQQAADFASRIRVHAIGDQDGTGAWIMQQFPSLWYINNENIPGIGQSGPYRGMYQNDTRTQADPSRGVRVAPHRYRSDQKAAWDQLVKQAWVEENIRGRGALGDLYPMGVWQGPTGDQWPRNGFAGVKEGDTPSWLYLLPNGLNVPQEPGFGGWGGRFRQPRLDQPLFEPTADRHESRPNDKVLGQVWTVARWREAYQREFRARMDWAITGAPEHANHPPQSPQPEPYGYNVVNAVSDGELTIGGGGWTDPDGDPLSYHWWFYEDASTPGVSPTLGDRTEPALTIHVPKVDQPARLHLILEVTDQPPGGRVAMTRYQRVLVTVHPR